MNILVTGGKGFIGNHVCHELTERGHGVYTYDMSDGYDTRNEHTLEIATQDWQLDGVIHLAGILGTAELFDTPAQAVDINIKGALNVLQLCEKRDARYVGITMPQIWNNVYQATKECSMRLASAWHMHQGVKVSHVRAFNVYGQGQKVFGVQKLVPTVSYRAWRDEPMPIWGTGSQLVDLIWVGDVARMLVDALDFGDDNVFDAGTSQPRSVNTVVEMIRQITGGNSQYDYIPMRLGEHGQGVVAAGQGWAELGWHPTFNYEEFVKTVESYRDYEGS